jgi:hypothetical protein
MRQNLSRRMRRNYCAKRASKVNPMVGALPVFGQWHAINSHRQRALLIAVGSGTAGLTSRPYRSTFVLMQVETLGVARSLGWKVHMRCANGYRESTRSIRKCVYRKQLDLETLVATRGPNFPLGRLEGRLMCPACGNRRVTVVFEPPSNAMVKDG